MVEVKEKEISIFVPGYFEEAELETPKIEDGERILREYCSSCVKGKGKRCKIKMTADLSNEINFPFWSERFLTFDYQDYPNSFYFYTKFNMCIDYQTPQKTLPKIEREYIDAIERMISLKDEKLRDMGLI